MTDDVVKPDVVPEVKGGVVEDLSKLTDKDIKYRSKYKAAVAEKEELARKLEKTESEKKQMTQQIETSNKAAQQRVVNAELKALAISEGLKDLDLVKLIDLTNVKVDDNGEVVGLKEAVTDFKTRKPDFFGTNKMTSSSSNAGNVTETGAQKLDAMKLSPEEYAAQRRQYGLR
jgi:hypothetical protein